MMRYRKTLFLSGPVALAMALPAVTFADTIRLQRDDVIPVVMQTELNFRSTREGDTFRADSTDSRMLPWGSRLEGVVKRVERKRGDRPGYMDIEFTTIVLPDGRRSGFHGTPIALSSNYVTRDRNGRWEAKKGVKKETVVIGAAAGGLILGSIIRKPFEGAFIGALAGILIGETDKEHIGDGNIVIPKGSKVGARLDGDLTLDYNGNWDDYGGYDRPGDYDRDGYNSAGYDRYGYDRRGRYNERYDTQRNGRYDSRDGRYDRSGATRNPARGDYGPEGYDRYGTNRSGDYNPRYDTTRDDRYGDSNRRGTDSYSDRNLSIEIDGRTLRFGNDERPFRVDSTVMVPLESTASQLNISVSKDRYSRSITLSNGEDEATVEQDQKGYRLNDRRGTLPAEVEVKSGITFVPIDIFALLQRGSVYINGTRYRPSA